MENHRENQIALFMDFENVAIWAGKNYIDLNIERIMAYLQSRGAVVIKRAYGDWSRFEKYLNDLVENSVDLIQMYSIRSGKNRADIRLALDAFETALHRTHIKTMAIVSGDSDFGELASKLRENGIYILGIGPRAITHSLLVKSCDEFIYLETLLAEKIDEIESSAGAQDAARKLLLSALAAHGMRGEIPVPGTKLKQTLLSLDPTFNEINLGYSQFRSWLEANADLVNLYFRGLQMFVAPKDFHVPEDVFSTPASPLPVSDDEARRDLSGGVAADYRSLFTKVITIDLESRRDILRMIYRKLSDHPEGIAYSTLLDEIQSHFEERGQIYSRSTIRKVMQLSYHQQGHIYQGPASTDASIWLADDLENETQFIQRAESRFPHAIIKAGLELDPGEIALTLLSDRSQVAYVQSLLDDLEKRGEIIERMGKYRSSSESEMPLEDDPWLEQILHDLKKTEIPPDIEQPVQEAKNLANSARSKRTHNFSEAAEDLLLASAMQRQAYLLGDENATLEDLRWYVASYASVKAGELAQVRHDYEGAKPYYLSFFSLVQEDTALWEQMRGLINPMLSYYWINLARQLNMVVEPKASLTDIAIQFATSDHEVLRSRWLESTRMLAQINPGILQRIANTIRLLTGHPKSSEVADTIEGMLNSKGAAALD